MQAIITKVIPATTHKPTRIKATCARGSLTISRHHPRFDNTADYGRHIIAAKMLCEKFVKEDYERHGGNSCFSLPFATGGFPDGSHAHVFIPKSQF